MSVDVTVAAVMRLLEQIGVGHSARALEPPHEGPADSQRERAER